MAFNFLGTFSEEEIQALFDFADAQLQDIDARINHLQSRIQRVGWLEYEFDEDNQPISWRVVPSGSELQKYVHEYLFYGGDLLDLGIKSRGQWVHFSKGEFDSDAYIKFQGNKPQGGEYRESLHLDDAEPGIAVDKMKRWMIPAIKAKRENAEFKIKKTCDLLDQYLEEIILLVKRSSGAETIEDLKSRLQQYLSDDSYHSAGKKGFDAGQNDPFQNS